MSSYDWIYDERTFRKFFSYIDKKSYDECWEWLGAYNKKDLNPIFRIKFQGKRITGILVRKAIWMAKHGGKLSRQVYVVSNCGNYRCVNPNHLRLKTFSELAKENEEQRKKPRNREPDLYTEDVILKAIKLRDGYNISFSVLAKRFGGTASGLCQAIKKFKEKT